MSKQKIWLLKAGALLLVGVVTAHWMQRSLIVLSVIEVLLHFATLYVGYKYGAGPGSMVGMVCGVLETMRTEDMVALGVFCLIGALAGVFRSLSRLASVMGFVSGMTGIGILYSPPFVREQALEMIAAVSVFLLLPKNLLKQEREIHVPLWEPRQDLLERPWVDKLQAMADSLTQVSRTFEACKDERIPLSRSAAVAVFEQAAKQVCGHCRECGMGRICEQENQYYIYYFVHIFEQHGIVERERMPRLFLEICDRQEAYLTCINEGLGQLRSRDGWEGRFLESRQAIASQFKEMGDILQEFTEELVATRDVTSQVEGALAGALKNRHIQAEELLVLEHGNKTREAVMMVCTDNGCRMTTRELAEVVGRSTRRRFRPAKDCKTVIGPEICRVKLVEDTQFMMLHGVARSIKAGEEISGDQFAFQKIPEGRMLLCLSDGMGSGPMAALESETAIELTEQLLGAGFSPERSVQLINSVLLMKNREQAPTTLDVTVVDLYTGTCRVVKSGAAPTFRKRGNQVEVFGAESLPVGIVGDIETVSQELKLQDGDWLIMVTDGVLDALSGVDKEAAMKTVISQQSSRNPRDFAERILRSVQQNTEAKDDMTVMVVGIWEK